MPSKKSFRVGDRVMTHGRIARIEAVEKPADKKLHPTLDMGRYKIRYEDDGSTLSNAPGYLMARPGAIRRRE